jgi:hypothetical protein
LNISLTLGAADPAAAAAAVTLPIAPVVAFKEKRKIGSKKVTPWVWMPYRNSGRVDDVMFSRWQKNGESPEGMQSYGF